MEAAGRETAIAAAAVVQFDTEFLVAGGGRNVDISRFEKGVVVLPGVYRADVQVNGDYVTRMDVQFRSIGDDVDAVACVDESMLARFGVDMGQLDEATRARFAAAAACERIEDAIADATVHFDFAAQRLDVSIPQAAMVRRARGYVDPSNWDAGVNAASLGYSFNAYRQKMRGYDAVTQGYLGLNAGLNVAGWRLRHDGSYSFDTRGRRDYQAMATYAKREVAALSAELTIGEAFTSGDLFDSVGFRGVRLETDDRMLPESRRGYAPTVRGVANSNARITIRQSGSLIHETTVAPGAFEIDDLYATGYGGDLEVTIQEADGSQRVFSVPFAAVPLSLRPGVSRFSATMGELRQTQAQKEPLFAQGTWQHGLSNRVTGYAGITAAQNYAAGMVGVALNTRLGALGADVTQSSTELTAGNAVRGASYRLSYARDIAASGTNVSIAAYRYSTGGFYGLGGAMQAREAERHSDVWAPQRQRNRASLSLGQRLGERHGRIHATASLSDYWNRQGSDVNYSFGYSGSLGRMNYGVSANRLHAANGRAETQYYASLTIPLGDAGRTRTLTSNLSHNDSGRSRVQSTLSGTAGEGHQLAYGLSVAHARGGDMASDSDLNANLMYRASKADLQASMALGSNYSQASVGARGALVIHPEGWTLSQPLSETFGIVEVADAQGARVLNASGVKVDGRGYAVVPHLTPYRSNTISIDPKGLSTDVELKLNSQQVTPRAGAVAMVRFATESGRSAVLEVRRQDGSVLPFGANVLDEDDKEVGVVGQGGRIFVRGLREEGMLNVRWADDARALCRIDYRLPARAGRDEGIQVVPGQCVTQVADTREPDASPVWNYVSGE
ncbi:fimbria/pilus outer membrane usher protein [Stenotrophomonas sp. SY1]|uniref:fimbria/pilus outer membrane usher protein n=1 Tax=Stenotrophomonas sp. SY1 TaxID=477235 RepID=UPI001E325504|nr:fimbria/pilus outer membrane usher protein [Stenotrophomonas sp. SY1]MCD9085427.1 fimbrial biogenesis outer membrane usher protein [Stenotrophomonas sp. SY1]